MVPLAIFVGFVVSVPGLFVDPTKIQSIHTWTQPTTLTDLCGFLKLSFFYRRFIKNFSTIATLTDLT